MRREAGDSFAFVVAFLVMGGSAANACDSNCGCDCGRRSYYQYMPAYFLAPPAYHVLPLPGDYVLPALHGRPYYTDGRDYPPPNVIAGRRYRHRQR